MYGVKVECFKLISKAFQGPLIIFTCIVFPFIIWFYGSAIAIIRGWGCGFGNSEHIVTWSDNRPSFTVLGFMAVVAYCRGI
jgi:hypothetical protein